MTHYSDLYLYYLIYLGARKLFRKIMQHMFFNEISRYINIYGPQPPRLSRFFL